MIQLTLFFSWQTDLEQDKLRQKSFLIDCLEEACTRASTKDVQISLLEGMREIAGSPRVSQVMMDRVDDCDIYVADVSVAYDKIVKKGDDSPEDRKKSPNPNAYGEYHRALARGKEMRTILVMNTLYGDPRDTPEVIPFDTRDYRFPILFKAENQKECNENKEELITTLSNAITACAKKAIEIKSEKYRPFKGWLEAGYGLHPFFYMDDSRRSIERQIENNHNPICIVGDEGCGKRAFLLYVFGKNESDKSRFFYADCKRRTYSELEDMIERICKDFAEPILVLDRCELQYAQDLVSYIKRHGLKARIIVTSENDIESDGIWDVFKIPSKQYELVSMVCEKLKPFYSDKDYTDKLNKIDGNLEVALKLYDRTMLAKEMGDIRERGVIEEKMELEPGDIERSVIGLLAMFEHVEVKSAISLFAESGLVEVPGENVSKLIKMVENRLYEYDKREFCVYRDGKLYLENNIYCEELITDWLGKVESGRFNRILETLVKEDIPYIYVTNLLARLKGYGKDNDFSGYVRHFADNLKDGIWDFVDTEKGSSVIEWMTSEYPDIFSPLVKGFFDNVTDENLQRLDAGKSRLVNTLVRLASNQKEFAWSCEQLLRIAKYEDEIGYNREATNAFITLFQCEDAPTDTPLNVRGMILTGWLNTRRSETILYALLRALKPIRGILPGANVVYRPRLEDKQKYKAKIVESLLYAYEQVPEWRERIIREIPSILGMYIQLNQSVAVFQPLIEKISAACNYDWEEMRKVINLSMNNPKYDLRSDTDWLKSLLDKMTPQDIVFRYKHVQENVLKGQPKDFYEEQQRAYSELGKEFATNYKKDDWNQILRERMGDNSFAVSMANHVDDDLVVNIVRDGVEMLSSLRQEDEWGNDTLLAHFVANRPNEYEVVKQIVIEHDLYDLLFPIVALRKASMRGDEVLELLNFVKQKKASAQSFVQYWMCCYFIILKDDDIEWLFERISKLPEGPETIVRMGGTLSMFSSLNKYPLTLNVLVKALEAILKKDGKIIHSYDFISIENAIIPSGNYPDLMCLIIKRVLENIKSQGYNYVSTFVMDTIIEHGVNYYFEDVWPILSEAMLVEDKEYLYFYNVSSVLTSEIARGHDLAYVFDKNHEVYWKDWCKKSAVAPERLYHMLKNGQNDELRDWVRETYHISKLV